MCGLAWKDAIACIDNLRSFAQIVSIPIGYNYLRLMKTAQSPEMVRALVDRPVLGSFPSTEWFDTLRQGILREAQSVLTKSIPT